MSLAELEKSAVPSDLTAEQSESLASQVFIRIADGKIGDMHVPLFLETARRFKDAAEERHRSEDDEWQKPLLSWGAAVRALDSVALRNDLRALSELTDEHRELVLDPSRNTVFNYGALGSLLDDYLAKNPGLRIPNRMRGTLLYNATPGCRHASDGRFSGVGCKHCPGWFCF